MVDSSLRWDPERSTFEPSGHLILPRIEPGVTKLRDGRVLVAGGLDEAGKVVSAAELWDPIIGTFASTGSLGKDRFGHSSTLLSDGRVLVIGGAGLVAHGVETHATAEIWGPGSGTFHAATSLHLGPAAFDGRLPDGGAAGHLRSIDELLARFRR